ncbi:unnamed protein product [Paramecium pentaurelia]|uniref:Uncharacterized protein n=1 Tax=Paramecium pentaurelia TaxID=43138 RepID=A0A8S1X7W2_9CILI|nr:unnamed protein product [Paramecium pentaurelia]
MNHIPIHQRAQHLMKEKQQKIAEYKRLKELNEEQECSKYSFRPNINKDREHRTVDQFLEEVDYWIERKNEQLHLMQQEKQQEELKGLTFKPKINKKSQRLISDQNSSLLQRCQKTQINKQMNGQHHLIEELKKTPFCPQLNANSIKLACQSKTPERSISPNLKQQYTPRIIGKSTSRTPQKTEQRVSTQTTTPLRQNQKVSYHKPTNSMASTTVNSNNNSKKAVLPLQNVTNHMKFIVDLVNKTPPKGLF